MHYSLLFTKLRVFGMLSPKGKPLHVKTLPHSKHDNIDESLQSAAHCQISEASEAIEQPRAAEVASATRSLVRGGALKHERVQGMMSPCRA